MVRLAMLLLLLACIPSAAQMTVTIEGTPAGGLPIAAADGTTKGIASFAVNDFECTAGNCSIDYILGQAASSTFKGFLTPADWNRFDEKQNALTFTPEDVSRKDPSALLWDDQYQISHARRRESLCG